MSEVSPGPTSDHSPAVNVVIGTRNVVNIIHYMSDRHEVTASDLSAHIPLDPEDVLKGLEALQSIDVVSSPDDGATYVLDRAKVLNLMYKMAGDFGLLPPSASN
jgi:hypothetical protein